MMNIQTLSLKRLLVVAFIAFTSTFATYVATAMQNANAVSFEHLFMVMQVQAVKGFSISATASLAAIVAFFTRPDAVMPANSLTSVVQEVREED